jgi:hypothetical protein
MIWHIFKKDLKILWPFALLVAVFHSATLVFAVMGGITGNPPSRAVNLLRNLVTLGPLASGLLIAAAVHLDAIPGLRQDWLVRPIRRRDLMLAKLLFAALAVQSPILIVNAAAFLIGGFSPLSSLNNAAQHSLLQMLAINVPFVALASITRNLLELVSGVVALCSQTALVASDPASSRLRQIFDCYSEGVVAMAEEFPLDKYAPQQILTMTVGHMVAHVAALNDFGCSKVAGTAPPEFPKEDGGTDKDNLVAFLKSSVDFCKEAFSTLIDAKLGESVSWDGAPPNAIGQRVTRIAAVLLVIDDLIERYIALDVYLQMNSLPTIPTLSTLDSVPLVEKGSPRPTINPEDYPLPDTPLSPPTGGSASPR